jgi:glyoxylase-like metal-dependent hydrolase (beta-lactamase superfamily II)
MKEVLPGIYQINLTLSGFNPDSVNVYLIRTENGFLSVDTGWDSPPSVKSMQDQMHEIGASFSDINQIVITHCHIDHLGMIPRIKNISNAKIYIHEKEIELIKVRFTGGDNFLPLTDGFLKTHGFPPEELVPPEIQLPSPGNLTDLKPEVLLRGGEEIKAGQYTLKVINAPGHTPGHIVLYEPVKKFAISGDLLLPNIATNAAFHVQHIENPMKKYLDTLRYLRKLDIQLVLPGHEHVYSNPAERIDKLLLRSQKKANEIFGAFSDGQPKTAYAISRMLAWNQDTRTNNWNNLTGWDKRLAVLQTIAYLEEIAYSEKLTRFSKDGKIYYR